MFLVQNDDMVQTFPPKRTHHPFGDGVYLSAQMHLMVLIHRELLRLFILFTHCMAKSFPW
jgi:hypothetical protein